MFAFKQLTRVRVRIDGSAAFGCARVSRFTSRPLVQKRIAALLDGLVGPCAARRLARIAYESRVACLGHDGDGRAAIWSRAMTSAPDIEIFDLAALRAAIAGGWQPT